MSEVVIERGNGTRRVVQICEGPSLTEQHHADEVDINQIVLRYQKTGVLPHRGGTPSYGDFSGVVDYHSACEAVRQAEAEFMTLPPDVRKKFGNDPGALLAFLADEDNRAEAVRLGIVEAIAPDEPPIVPVEAPSVAVPGQTPS